MVCVNTSKNFNMMIKAFLFDRSLAIQLKKITWIEVLYINRASKFKS